jgi:hypothetical protein
LTTSTNVTYPGNTMTVVTTILASIGDEDGGEAYVFGTVDWKSVLDA